MSVVWWPDAETVRPWLEANGYHARDWGLLHSALARPHATFGGEPLYAPFWEKLAALLDSVERTHPLLDGNKRLGYLVTRSVLLTADLPDDAVTDDEWYDLIIDVSSGHMDVPELAARLEKLFGRVAD